MEINDVDNVSVNIRDKSISSIADLSRWIPTYPITATYMGPIGMYLYFKYGRAKHPSELAKDKSIDHMHHEKQLAGAPEEASHSEHASGMQHHDHEHMHHSDPAAAEAQAEPVSHNIPHEGHEGREGHEGHQKHEMTMHDIHMHDMGGPPRPFWATVLIGISHCGTGCVLGDLVGEWLIFGTGSTINGADTWPCLLVDYGFALFFGIFFQYFSIAPMSGDYGVKTLIRAAKADILSLTAFEIGLFGWMVAYQVGIWNYRLPMSSWTYWWMMQVGMTLGFITAMPINYWLLKHNIKEPCA
jgi:Domain of unknown function (DUF4396)